tara:strand:- start:261 stop:485 length:225 start_codon:yes stop_codon:yes gene_type:complete
MVVHQLQRRPEGLVEMDMKFHLISYPQVLQVLWQPLWVEFLQVILLGDILVLVVVEQIITTMVDQEEDLVLLVD